MIVFILANRLLQAVQVYKQLSYFKDMKISKAELENLGFTLVPVSSESVKI